jgi:hypothetical protein
MIFFIPMRQDHEYSNNSNSLKLILKTNLKMSSYYQVYNVVFLGELKYCKRGITTLFNYMHNKVVM